jgi:CRP-like cAMP-binding protein
VLIDHEGFGLELLIVGDGTAEVTRGGRHVADPVPEAIGEVVLLDGRPRTATVTATMTLVAVSKRVFDTVLDRVPGLLQALLRTLATRLREADLAAYDE